MREYFKRLRGNDAIKNRIGRAIENGVLPHAFLIDGDDGSGKTTLALEIAAALNCENTADISMPRPCGVCNNCRKIYEGGFVDVKFLKRDPDKATLGIGKIKDFRSDMFLSTTESDYKVYVIDEAEKMTVEAQNALLIVLEEPPKNVIILLLASGTDRILTTIKSRTQYLSMSRFSTDEIRDFLQNEPRSRLLPPETIGDIAISADGRIGRALNLLSPAAAEEENEMRTTVLNFLRALKRRTPYSELYAAIKAFPTKKAELFATLEGIIKALRDLIILKKAEDADTCFFAHREEALDIANNISIKRLVKIYDLINRAHEDCTKNTNLNALLTTLCAKIKLTKG